MPRPRDEPPSPPLPHLEKNARRVVVENSIPKRTGEPLTKSGEERPETMTEIVDPAPGLW